MSREHGRSAMSERGGRRALCARFDLEQLQRELLAFLGERTRGGREPFALRERLLERDEAFPREADTSLEILLFAHRRTGGGIGVVGQAAQVGGRRAGGDPARVGQLRLQLREQTLRGLVPDTERLGRAAEGEQSVAPAAGELRLRFGTAGEHVVELGGKRGLRGAFDRSDACPPSFGLDLQARALRRRRLGGRRCVACGGLQADRRRGVVGASRLELGAQRRAQGCGRLAAQRDALAAAPQPVQRRGRLLAGAGGIGELLLGALALGDEGVDLQVERSALLGRRGPAPFGLGSALGEAGEVERRDRRLQARDLDPELLGPLGCGRLQRQRAKPLLDLLLEIARAVDLHRHAGELQLGAVPAALEPAEAGRLLDQLAALGRLRVEHGLDAALRDHRAEAAAETDVGQELDQVDAAHRRLVDEVLALAAAVQPTRDGDLAVREVGPFAVGVVEQQVDLAEVRRLAPDRAREQHVVRLLRAQLARAHRPGRPEDRIRDVRFPGAVRPDDDRHSRLEVDLDRLDERLEAAQLDRFQVHARIRLSSGQDAARFAYFVPAPTSNSHGPLNAPADLELPERGLDLCPGCLTRRLVELGQHLVQRAERLPLELGALGRRGEPERSVEPLHLHLAEPCFLEQLAEVRGRERPREARAGRRQLGVPADDRDRHREEAVPLGLGEDDRRIASADAQRLPGGGECSELVRQVHQSEPGDGCVEGAGLDVERFAVHHPGRDAGKARSARRGGRLVEDVRGDVGGEHHRAPPRSLERLPARAGGDVEHTRPLADLREVEHPLRRFTEPAVEDRIPTVPRAAASCHCSRVVSL